MTGGSDHRVCIWNLLPAISLKYEKPESAAGLTSGAKNGGADLEIIEEKKHEDEDHKMVSESDR